MAKILVVDDEQLIRDIFSRILESDGHTVTVASDGEVGLQILLREDFDLLVSDVEMAKPGYEMINEAGESVPPAIIMISGKMNYDGFQAGLELMIVGAMEGRQVEFMSKPLRNITDLTDMATKCLSG
jgi:CheY-like chemotaxis protein